MNKETLEINLKAATVAVIQTSGNKSMNQNTENKYGLAFDKYALAGHAARLRRKYRVQ